MEVILFTVPGSPPIIGKVIEYDSNFIMVEYPVILMKEESYVASMPYMPFAKNGRVFFSKQNLLSISSVDDEIVKHYAIIVQKIKDTNIIVSPPEEEKIEQLVHKNPNRILH